MKLVIENAADLAIAIKLGAALFDGEAPKPRGRPAGAKNKPKDAEEIDDDVTEDDDDEVPAPAPASKKKKPAPVAVVADEEDDDEEDDSDDEDDDDEEIEDEEDFVTGDDLAKLKKALTGFSKAKGSKDAAVKVLRKFAPSSEKVKASDLSKLLKALKV